MLEIQDTSSGCLVSGKIDGDVLLCGTCHQQISDITSFILHKSEHIKDKSIYSCVLCEKAFTSHTVLLYHYRTTHKVHTWSHCETEDSSFSNAQSPPAETGALSPKHAKSILQHSELVDTNMNFLFILGTNNVQGSIFSYGRTVFKCVYCTETCYTKEGLVGHMHGKHANSYWSIDMEVELAEGEQALSLAEYESQLKSTEGKREHLEQRSATLTTSEKPCSQKFICKVCGKMFTKRQSLQLHAKTHSTEFLCNCCGEAFQSKEQAAIHRRTHRGKLYKCPQCDFQSSINSMIHLHRQKHRLGTVACEICNCAYPDRSTLSKHMCVHDKGRPYVCCYEGCAWRFKTEMMLKAHVQAHTTRGKFECSTCGYTFRRKHHLSRHLIKMHGIIPTRSKRRAPQKRCSGASNEQCEEQIPVLIADDNPLIYLPSNPAAASKEQLQAPEEELFIKQEEAEDHILLL
ncbi:zinc finger protein 585A-like [Rhinatrema bivittatum]|uniref:zinc finger protein 585A-like n=1 Tax=Rhinatrema bivittatum TaxID=194408 RepID=UPI00112E2E59|nr:zinc finger protein 585A-like [Rhinatrema bivittatum]